MSRWVIRGRRKVYSEERIAREFWDFRTAIAVDFVLTLRQWGNRIPTFQDAGIRIPHWRSDIPQKNGTPRTDLPSVGDSVSSMLSLPSHEGLQLRILPIKQTTYHFRNVYCPAVHFVQGETCQPRQWTQWSGCWQLEFDSWRAVIFSSSPLPLDRSQSPTSIPPNTNQKLSAHEAYVHLATWVRTHEDTSVPLQVWKPEQPGDYARSWTTKEWRFDFWQAQYTFFSHKYQRQIWGPASLQRMGTGRSFPRRKANRAQSRLPHPLQRFRITGAAPPLPHVPSWCTRLLDVMFRHRGGQIRLKRTHLILTGLKPFTIQFTHPVSQNASNIYFIRNTWKFRV